MIFQYIKYAELHFEASYISNLIVEQKFSKSILLFQVTNGLLRHLVLLDMFLYSDQFCISRNQFIQDRSI